MKDQLMQKVTQVPSYPEISETKALATPQAGETTALGKERKNRKSAAMIGLAISMGATGVLLPGHSLKAMAANSPVEVAPLTNVSETTEPTQEAVKLVPPEIKHTVRQGETIWDLSKNYEIAPEQIASSNRLKGKAPLLVGQTVNIPVPEVSETSPSETLPSASVNPQLPVGQALPVRDNVDELLQQPRQGKSPVIASYPNVNSNLNSSEMNEQGSPQGAIAIQVSPPAQTTPTQLPTLTYPQPSAVPLNLSANPSTTGSRIEQPKVIQESGKPIPIPPPQIGMVSNPKASRQEEISPAEWGTNIPPVQNPVPQGNQNQGAENPTIEALPPANMDRPVVIPVSAPISNSSQPSNPVAIRPLPQVIRQDSLPPVYSHNYNSQPERQFYQVRSGDTLNSIARRYGISRGELMQANGITNPNLIKISQQLVIPSKSTSGYQNKGTKMANLNSQPRGLGNDNSEMAQANNPYINTLKSEISKLQQSSQNQPTNDQQGVPIAVEAPLNNSQESTPVDTNPEWGKIRRPRTQNYNSEMAQANNPYINTLKSEISNLQQSAQNQPTNNQEGIPIAVEAPLKNSQDSTPVAINPEWQKNQRNYLPEPTSEGNYNNIPFEQPQIIGAVPIAVEQYNPLFNPANGQPVSPDSYFPNNTSPFTGYIWPAKGVLTSGYGWRWGRMHKGIDVAAPVGTPVMAAAAGEVITAGWNSGGYGNLVKVRHFDGSVTLYGHNSRILVRKGQFVEQGQQISEMGSTGFSTGPHLHFEVHPYGKGATNPIAFLPPR